MPFGTRDDGLDFDLVYAEVLRPAGEEAGYEVLRIDEVKMSGAIADQYLRELFLSDLAIADLSIPNGNVYYELGIRQAVSTGATILVAREGSPLPFDLAYQRVFRYRVETAADRASSRRDLLEIIRHHVVADNPIRRFLEGIGFTSNPGSNATEFEQELQGRIQRAHTLEQLVAVWKWYENLKPLPALPLLSLAEKLAEHEAWSVSVQVLQAAAAARPRDFEIFRQLGFHLRHVDDLKAAQEAFETALALNPHDPETLGMLGGLLKRQGRFREARAIYDRGAALVPSNQYMRVNQAALAILASPGDPSEGIALYRALLDDIERDRSNVSDVWAQLVSGEAAFAIGRSEASLYFSRAMKLTNSRKPLRSAVEQLELFATIGFRSDEAMQLAAQLNEPVEIAIAQGSPEVSVESNSELPVVIHLSDPHFGTMMKDGRETEMHRFFDGDYSTRLSMSLRGEFMSQQGHFSYDSNRLVLVISGDLTCRGEEVEFKRVAEFLSEICSELGVPPARVIIVPGNHDVHWPSIEVATAHRFDNYLSFLMSFYGDELFRRRYPRVSWNFRVDSPRPRPEDIVAIYDEKITIIGLNSCVYETNQDHYGFIGGQQLKTVESLLAGDKAKTRIAVFHHHLHPFPEPLPNARDARNSFDTSTLRDAGLVEQILERLDFDLVLHGHKHKPQFRETLVRGRNERGSKRAPLIVCGGGSVGVNSRELEHNISNQYGIIEFLRAKRVRGVAYLRLEWRELSLDADAQWATSEQWTVLG